MLGRRPPTGAREEPPPRLALGPLKRALVAGVIVVALTATAVATAALLQVQQITEALRQAPRLQLGTEITPAEAGAPQTILLIGSDKRAKAKSVDRLSPPHSDTLMLVRLDPSQRGTALLSIPRDLKVPIPLGHGRVSVQKINAAFAIGGPRLTVRTVKQVLGVQINHVVDVNFHGFQEAVNAVGCIYVDVDRRYFNDNSGAAYGQAYAAIDIQPGYQRLCGRQALDYARYRHTDTDIVRAARQQGLLRQAKEQVGVAGLIGKRAILEQIFGRYAQTDVRSTGEVLRLFKLMAFSVGRPVVQVHFEAQLGPSYVTATSAEIATAVHAFLHGGEGGAAAPARAPTRRAAPASTRHRRRAPHAAGAPAVQLTPATSEDVLTARTAARSLGFELYAPHGRVQFGATPDQAHDYTLRDEQGHAHRAYRIVVAQGLVGDYYGIEGTTWLDPPLLSHPDSTITLRGRRFELFYDGQHLRDVAWRTASAVYWLANTLTDSLTNREMEAIASRARPVAAA